MVYQEMKGNIFESPTDFVLVHCISADFTFLGFLSNAMDGYYNTLSKLKESYPNFHFSGKGVCLYTSKSNDILDMSGLIASLVVKPSVYDRASLDAVEQALQGLCQVMYTGNLSNVAISLSDLCGSELDAVLVKVLIKKVFLTTNFTVWLYD